MKIETPGIYRDFPTADYFADPTPEPSFTQSLAKILIEQSPLHAFMAHPRLTVPSADEDDAGEKYDKAKAIGNAAHALMLHRGKTMAIGDFDSWRGKIPQAFKDEAVSAGKEPILLKHYVIAEMMVEAANDQLNRIHGCQSAFTSGDAEVVIANCEGGIWLRSMLDWITPDLREVWDLKTSGMSASPYNTGKLMASAGWHTQAAMHERILDALDPKGAGRRHFYYVCQENEAPFALTVNEIGEAALTIGRKQIDYAIKMWAHCLTQNTWPAYPLRIIRPELPAWAENGWLARELAEDDERQEVARRKDFDPRNLLAG
jgi:hypothetical protein